MKWALTIMSNFWQKKTIKKYVKVLHLCGEFFRSELLASSSMRWCDAKGAASNPFNGHIKSHLDIFVTFCTSKNFTKSVFHKSYFAKISWLGWIFKVFFLYSLSLT